MAATSAAADIRIELQRGPVSVKVNWPATAMAECGAWLREILR
jgi:transposase